MLGRLEMSIAECIDAYIYLSGRVFQSGWWHWPVDWRFRPTPRFSSAELEMAIKHIIKYCDEDADALLIQENPQCKM